MTEDKSPQAVHLAAGQGTRLRPLTNDRPKPLVTLGGTSLLERNMQTLRGCGVTDQVVVTGHCSEKIRSLGCQTVHNPNFAETDMVYSLFCAAARFSTDRDLVISYGDIVYEESVVQSLLDRCAPLSVVVDRDWQRLWKTRFEDPLSDAESLRLTDDDAIVEIGRDVDGFDEIDGQYIGLIKVESDFIDQFETVYQDIVGEASSRDKSIEMTQFLQTFIDRGHDVAAVPINGGWLEVDTVSDLEQYWHLYSNDELDRFIDLEQSEHSQS
ncbi:NTP transferase domain-containing protein [Haloarcula nitratireducens]|uniref:Phosphocholine cytidylyltransferase family protein n=1 Tax=Haloarcula nitratireducens TaxID=2487749 RepID=A0AAW4PJD5_9EURY|nr:phosphocholine cytidylyltransferase family protein [Halomicroarcula nitratireducens]MBX0297763.1 phosphocholine cytidylyltransferase family protein [Halomicroarcula nitratireducens]